MSCFRIRKVFSWLCHREKPVAKGVKEILSVHDVPTSQYSTTSKLPTWINEGIGAASAAQSYLERQIFVLLCDLMVIDQPEGRVVLKDQSARDRFNLVKTCSPYAGLNPPPWT
jgi:hypothetical protein